MNRSDWLCVGIDLAGVEKRPTGLASIDTLKALEHCVVHTDDEIVDYVETRRPRLVVVDAPLSIPRGRVSLDVPSVFHLRECDKELLKRRIRFFPVTLGPMRVLTKRGMRLAARLRSQGHRVFEGYPGGSQDILGVPRKGMGVTVLAEGLCGLGLRVGYWTHDELDAATLAYVGFLYLRGKAELIGDRNEGEILLPLREV
jgi:predicted nuclease with RNAse H fold